MRMGVARVRRYERAYIRGRYAGVLRTRLDVAFLAKMPRMALIASDCLD